MEQQLTAQRQARQAAKDAEGAQLVRLKVLNKQALARQELGGKEQIRRAARAERAGKTEVAMLATRPAQIRQLLDANRKLERWTEASWSDRYNSTIQRYLAAARREADTKSRAEGARDKLAQLQKAELGFRSSADMAAEYQLVVAAKRDLKRLSVAHEEALKALDSVESGMVESLHKFGIALVSQVGASIGLSDRMEFVQQPTAALRRAKRALAREEEALDQAKERLAAANQAATRIRSRAAQQTQDTLARANQGADDLVEQAYLEHAGDDALRECLILVADCNDVREEAVYFSQARFGPAAAKLGAPEERACLTRAKQIHASCGADSVAFRRVIKRIFAQHNNDTIAAAQVKGIPEVGIGSTTHV
eukprot:TRINITY_DN3829_c0_g1_i5.p1 TRINITY_DN3829_c0_g1~~TRINITY_DN3829_c0_g1_i5.p1  ORF type:complete len:366 (+),score=91.57 TRINITY_DN3829_c0_g1_i5:299-1396(+)